MNIQQTDSVVKQEFVPKIDITFLEKKVFNAEKLSEFQSSDDFIYEIVKPEPNIFQRFWNWIKNGIRSFLQGFLDDINPTIRVLKFILDIIPYLILLIAIYFIVKYFINVKTKSILEGKNEDLVAFDKDDELLRREDLEQLLFQSVQDQNFRLSIRFLYLIALKKLRDREIIQWQQQKTNDDYIQELKGKSYQSLFIETTNLYDFVWYGKFDINELEFQKAEKTFKELHQKIV